MALNVLTLRVFGQGMFLKVSPLKSQESHITWTFIQSEIDVLGIIHCFIFSISGFRAEHFSYNFSLLSIPSVHLILQDSFCVLIYLGLLSLDSSNVLKGLTSIVSSPFAIFSSISLLNYVFSFCHVLVYY